MHTNLVRTWWNYLKNAWWSCFVIRVRLWKIGCARPPLPVHARGNMLRGWHISESVTQHSHQRHSLSSVSCDDVAAGALWLCFLPSGTFSFFLPVREEGLMSAASPPLTQRLLLLLPLQAREAVDLLFLVKILRCLKSGVAGLAGVSCLGCLQSIGVLTDMRLDKSKDQA